MQTSGSHYTGGYAEDFLVFMQHYCFHIPTSPTKAPCQKHLHILLLLPPEEEGLASSIKCHIQKLDLSHLNQALPSQMNRMLIPCSPSSSICSLPTPAPPEKPLKEGWGPARMWYGTIVWFHPATNKVVQTRAEAEVNMTTAMDQGVRKYT